MKKINVSAIVPVFNEEKTVSGVLDVLLDNSLIDEVICVNDGSTDGSLKIIKSYKDKIRIINVTSNKGKGFALSEGIKMALGNIVVFIDADLVNLSNKHLEKLIDPMLKGKARAVLGYPYRNDYIPDIVSKLTGERAYYRKDLLPFLEGMSKTRFGVEVFLNGLFDDKETRKIPLKQLKGLFKYQKRSLPKDALREYLNEAVEIAREIGKREKWLLKDKVVVERLRNARTITELKSRVEQIYNKSVKQFFEKYILIYIDKDTFRLKN